MTPFSSVTSTSRQRSRVGLAILGLCLLYALCGLFRPLRVPDEIRVAEIGREMALSGDALVPRLGAEPFLEKPPLFFAAVGVCLRYLGVCDVAARLPGALAGVLTLLLAYALASRAASRLAGLLAVLVLASTAGFYSFGSGSTVDSALALFVTLGFLAYVRAAFPEAPGAEHRTRFILLFHAAAALSFWAKGPIGPVLLFAAATAGPGCGGSAFFRSRAHVPGLVLLLLACAAWPLLLYARGGLPMLREFAVQNVLYRIRPDADAYTGGHVHPFWYYLVKLPPMTLPWLVLLPAAVLWSARGPMEPGWNRGALRFLGAELLVGLVVLSIPGTKRGMYLLPVIIPPAVLVGAWLASTVRRADLGRLERGTLQVFGGGVVLLPALLLAGAAWTRRQAAGAPLERTRLDEVALELCSACGLRRLVPGGEESGPGRSRWLGPLAAALCFAAFLAANVFRTPSLEKDLQRLVQDLRDADVLNESLMGYDLSERVRAVVPFRTGWIVPHFRDPARLEERLEDDPDAVLLSTEAAVKALPARVRRQLVPTARWQIDRSIYALYRVAVHD